MVYLALELVGSWVELSFSVGIRYGDFWVSSCLLMFPGVRSSLMFSSFGVKPPASGFLPFCYSSLKTSPCSTLHIQEHPERFTEIQRREEGGKR